jgi:hypothetical protein
LGKTLKLVQSGRATLTALKTSTLAFFTQSREKNKISMKPIHPSSTSKGVCVVDIGKFDFSNMRISW